MEQNLGAVRNTIKCPEKIAAQAPLWRDILLNLIPMLILGFVLRALSLGAGLGNLGANIVFIFFTALFTLFCVYITRLWKKRYAETHLNIHDKGLSGVCPVNAFKSQSFAFPYSDLRVVSGKKNRLTLNTASKRYTPVP